MRTFLIVEHPDDDEEKSEWVWAELRKAASELGVVLDGSITDDTGLVEHF